MSEGGNKAVAGVLSILAVVSGIAAIIRPVLAEVEALKRELMQTRSEFRTEITKLDDLIDRKTEKMAGFDERMKNLEREAFQK